MKTTVEIPDALFREVRAYAAGRGLSFKQVIEAGLRKVLDEGRQQKKKRVSAARWIVWGTRKGGRRGLAGDSAHDLRRARRMIGVGHSVAGCA